MHSFQLVSTWPYRAEIGVTTIYIFPESAYCNLQNLILSVPKKLIWRIQTSDSLQMHVKVVLNSLIYTRCRTMTCRDTTSILLKKPLKGCILTCRDALCSATLVKLSCLQLHSWQTPSCLVQLSNTGDAGASIGFLWNNFSILITA